MYLNYLYYLRSGSLWVQAEWIALHHDDVCYVATLMKHEEVSTIIH